MAGTPQWKKVLISGSNFEVNELTASADLGDFNQNDLAKEIPFISSEGYWQITSSIRYESVNDAPYVKIGYTVASQSVNINAPVSVSFVGDITSDPVQDLVSFPALFQEQSTNGNFLETTSSIGIDSTLEYAGEQWTIVNANIRSGSKQEGPNPSETAIFPLSGESEFNFPLTFTGSFSERNDTTYIKTNIGDYQEFLRGMPVGTGITASFKIPIIFNNSLTGKQIKVTLRRYVPGEYAVPTYFDETELVFDDGDFGWPQASLPYSASLTGSWEIDSAITDPIEEGERWQLRIRGNQAYSIGYTNPTDHLDVGAFQFAITGSTAIVGPAFTGNLSGSFAGDVFGGYSGSLYGVTLDDFTNDQAIQRGDGIVLVEDNGSAIVNFKGTNETTMSLRLYPMTIQGTSTSAINKSGLSLAGVSDATLFSGVFTNGVSAGGLELTDGLAGDGLEFSGTNKEQLSISYATNPGLTATDGKLHIANSFLGNGITGSFGTAISEGTASLHLSQSSGLSFTGLLGQDGALQLTSSLPGFGLEYSNLNDNSVLALDFTEVVSSSGEINFKTNAGGGQSLGVSNTSNFPTAFDINVKYNNTSPDNEGVLNLRHSSGQYQIGKDITFNPADVTVNNLTVLDNSNVSSIQVDSFRTTDQFPIFNSHSLNVSPFNFDNGGLIIQTGSDGGQASGSAIFFDDAQGGTSTIGDRTFSEIGWAVTKGRVPWDAHSALGDFTSNTSPSDITGSGYAATISTVKTGTGAPADNGTYFYDETGISAIGAWWIDTSIDPSQNDSNVYIFTTEVLPA